MINKVKSFILKHCERKAKELKVSIENIQVRFSFNIVNILDNEGNVIGRTVDQTDPLLYATCKNYAKFEDTSFKKICNFKLGYDFLNYEGNVVPFLFQSISNLCIDMNIEPQDIFVFAVPDPNFVTVDEESGAQVKEQIAVHIYHRVKGYLKTISVQKFVMSNMLDGGITEEDKSAPTAEEMIAEE